MLYYGRKIKLVMSYNVLLKFCLSMCFIIFLIYIYIYILFLFHLIHICSNPLCIILCDFDFLPLVLLMSFHCVTCIKPLALDSLFCLLIYVYIPISISIFGQFIQQHPFLCFSYFYAFKFISFFKHHVASYGSAK